MRRKIDCSIQPGDSRVEWNNKSFNESKYSYHCTDKNIHYLFYIIPDYCFQNQFIRHLKQHAFESYFSIWIISHSSQDRNQPKVNYEDRTKSFLTDGNRESAMEKTIALLGVKSNVFQCTLRK